MHVLFLQFIIEKKYLNSVQLKRKNKNYIAWIS